MDKDFKQVLTNWQPDYYNEKTMAALEILVQILRIQQKIEDFPLLPRAREKKELEITFLQKRFMDLIQ